MVFRLLQLLNMLYILVTADVLKLLKSRLVRLSQFWNMECIFVTFFKF